MKTRLVVLLASLPGFAAGLFAATPATSTITAATVYIDRAIVTRTAQLDVPAGESELAFEKLPASLMDQSLQVSGRGPAGATILDVSARITHVEATPDPRIKSLEDALLAENKKLRALNDRATILEQQGVLLNKIENSVTAPPTKDTAPARPSFDEWQKLLTFADETRTRLSAEQQSLETQRLELQNKINALQAQLDELRGRIEHSRSFKTVTVRLAAANAGKLDLTLAYALPGASWTPSYDARLRGEDRTVDLTYYGIVRQNTGEDWKNVSLTLSTARPGLGGAAPEPLPWIVDVAQPRYRGKNYLSSNSNVAVESLAASADSAFNYAAAGKAPGAQAPAPEPAALAQAEVGSAATSASFKIQAPATLLSDNATQKVSIGQVRLAANLQYQATPRLAETAFLSAYVTNTSDFPLLGGFVNTFLGDTFVASSSLKTVMPGEKFELALGADEGIAIKRKVVNRYTEDTGLTGGGRRITYDFLIIVTNNKKTPERIVFKETLPLSRNENIVVKLLTPAERDIGTVEKPREVSREPDNRLVWRLDLKPGEKREISLKISIDHPANLEISGLE